MLFQYVAGRFELSLSPQPAVTERFLTVIARGEDAPEGFFSDIESLMARPDACDPDRPSQVMSAHAPSGRNAAPELRVLDDWPGLTIHIRIPANDSPMRRIWRRWWSRCTARNSMVSRASMGPATGWRQMGAVRVSDGIFSMGLPQTCARSLPPDDQVVQRHNSRGFQFGQRHFHRDVLLEDLDDHVEGLR